jgi:hypothetical protein
MTAIRPERLGDTDKAGAEKSGPEKYALMSFVKPKEHRAAFPCGVRWSTSE